MNIGLKAYDLKNFQESRLLEMDNIEEKAKRYKEKNRILLENNRKLDNELIHLRDNYGSSIDSKLILLEKELDRANHTIEEMIGIKNEVIRLRNALQKRDEVILLSKKEAILCKKQYRGINKKKYLFTNMSIDLKGEYDVKS